MSQGECTRSSIYGSRVRILCCRFEPSANLFSQRCSSLLICTKEYLTKMVMDILCAKYLRALIAKWVKASQRNLDDVQWASTNPRQSLEALIRNQTLVAYQRLQRLTWMCLHVLVNAFKSSSISYLPCRRVASDSLYVGMPNAWSIDRTACRMFNRQNSQNNAILALNSIERPATFHRL